MLAESGGTLMHAPEYAGPTAQDAAESGGTLMQGGGAQTAADAAPQMANQTPAIDPYEVDGAQAGGPGTSTGTVGAARKDATLEQAFGGKHLMDRTMPAVMATSAMMQGLQSGQTPQNAAQPSVVGTRSRLHYSHDQNLNAPTDSNWAFTGGVPQYFKPGHYDEVSKFASGGRVAGAADGIASLPQADQSMGDTKRVRAIRSHYRSKKDVVADIQRGSDLPGQLGVQDPSDPILDVAFGYTARQGRHNPSMSPQFAEGGMIGGTKPRGMSDGEWKRLHYSAYGDASGDHMYLSAEERDGNRLGDEVMRTRDVEVHNPENANRAAEHLNRQPRIQMAAGGMPGRYVRGPGDGMSDSIPAHIDGRQPARIATNEYIVPADAVAHAGNGSSDAGARELDAMVARLRQARTGTASQAPRINPRKAMPR
jgi:hypothetical protein